MAGRKPTPIATLKAQGTLQPCRHSGDEAEYDTTIPDCPKWLTGPGKKEWFRVVRIMDKAGVMSESYMSTLAIYCQAFTDFVQAVRQIKKTGISHTTDKGYEVQSPSVNVKNKACDVIIKTSVELGLTPASRAKAFVNPKKDGDPFSALNKKEAG